jgi:hypothetical protein
MGLFDKLRIKSNLIKSTVNYKGVIEPIEIVITDGLISTKFFSKALCHEAYKYERAQRKIKTKLNDENNILMEFYPGKRKEELTEMVKKKFKKE